LEKQFVAAGATVNARAPAQRANLFLIQAVLARLATSLIKG
jgi:hypothetical protein